MLIEMKYSGTFFSKLNYPIDPALYEKSIYIEREGSKEKNILHLKITATYRFGHLYDSGSTDVLKCQTKYEFLTDGKIKDYEIYQAYKHSMNALSLELNRQERIAGLEETIHIKPLALRELQEDINDLIKRFH
jgi:hypothetical protein